MLTQSLHVYASPRRSDMSGHPTLTLPGGMTRDGMPVGFQIVSRAFDEAGILAAGHAYQQATGWHLERPPLGKVGV